MGFAFSPCLLSLLLGEDGDRYKVLKLKLWELSYLRIFSKDGIKLGLSWRKVAFKTKLAS